MAQCISPYYSKEHQMSFPCGKCYPCKSRRVSGWSFRMQHEAERSDSALFITLTYRQEALQYSPNGLQTLSKRHVQLFMKLLRRNTEKNTQNQIWDKKIKYYAVGEYGTKSKRPHYHLIIFNAEYANIEKSWPHGDVHYGQLSPASASYTLKYISKDSTKKSQQWSHINNALVADDRQSEFSLMSKKLGENYLTEVIKNWHREGGQDRFFVVNKDGQKLAMPRYYKNKIWNSAELQLIGNRFSTQADTEYQLKNWEEKLADDTKKEETYKYYAHINKETRSTTI